MANIPPKTVKCPLQHGCGIQLEDSVIITGGYWESRRVQRYSLAGAQEALPDMGWGRWDHACGSYVHWGTLVSLSLYTDDIWYCNAP